MVPLGLLSAGESGEIVAVRTAKPTAGGAAGAEGAKPDCRIEDLGLRVGCKVAMLNNSGGAVLLKVGESRLAVDRSLAMKIMVRGIKQ